MRLPDFTDLSNTSAEAPTPIPQQLDASWNNAGAPGAAPADANKKSFLSYFNPFSAAPKDTSQADRLTADIKSGKLAPQDAVSHVKDAYSHGWITREQAADLLVSNGLANKAGTKPPANTPTVPLAE
jgi:hypothetical protein